MRLRLALLLVLSGCYAGPARYYAPPPSPPPPPARRMLTEQEAVNVAVGFARSEGLAAARVKHVHLDGAGRWHVELRGDQGRDRGRVIVDGWTGQVLKARFGERDDD